MIRRAAVQGEGEAWGPELTSIGERRSAVYLRESLEKPAATGTLGDL